ncbi:unnamed protein product, partial [Phaeothamnion confervicola]
ETATITATSAAAALGVAAGGAAGIALSGAGAEATNVILTQTTAHIDSSKVTSAGNVVIGASDTSTILAQVVAASASIAVGGTAGIGASIGASRARNLIGWKLDGTKQQAQVQAYVLDSSITAADDLTQTATASETITATVLSGSVAAAGGTVGVAASGAGSSTENKIATLIKAYIDADGATGILADNVSLKADDTSTITATAGSASMAAAFGTVGVAVSVGLGLANNEISNVVEAYIKNADGSSSLTTDAGVTTRSGGDIKIEAIERATVTATAVAASAAVGGGIVGLSFSGAGADAKNVILTKTNAYVEGSDLSSGRHTILLATDTATIKAEVLSLSVALSGGLVAGAVSVGSSTANNLIGYTLAGVQTPAEVQAYVINSRIVAGGSLTQTATSNATVTASVAAGSVALAGGAVAAAGAGAGADVRNKVSTKVYASIEGNSARGGGVSAVSGVALAATDTSTITASSTAASVAGSAGLISGSAAIGVGLSSNLIANDVQAFIRSATVSSSVGGVSIQALETATMTATAQAAAVAASVSLGVSLAGGGASADATVLTTTKAFVETSTLTLAGNLAVSAQAATTAVARVDATASSVGLIAAASAGSVVSATVSPTVDAHVTGSTVTAGNVTVSASAQPKADVTATGLTVSTGVSVGVSRADATLSPVVTATVGGTITANSLSVSASHLLPTTGKSANAYAGASSGGLLIGVSATVARASNNAQVTAAIANNSSLNITGDVNVAASNSTRQDAEATAAAGGILAAGVADSRSSSSTSTTASLGSNVTLTASNLSVGAIGRDANYATTTAGSGGVAAGASAKAVTSGTSNTLATIGASSNVNLSTRGTGELSLSADHTASLNTREKTEAGGVIAGAGVTVDNEVISAVDARIGASAIVLAREIDLSATNNVDKPQFAAVPHSNPILAALGVTVTAPNVAGSTGGLASGAGISSDFRITLNTNVTVGASANVQTVGVITDASLIRMRAFNNILAQDNVTFRSGGALAGAGAYAKIRTIADVARVSIGDGATVVSKGALELSARGTGNLVQKISVDVFGAGTLTVGESLIDVRPLNEVVIGSAAISAYGDLDISAGSDTDFNSDRYTLESRFDGIAGSLVPIESVDAKSFLIQENRITVGAGAYLKTAGVAKLHTERDSVNDLTAKAKITSWTSAVGDGLLALTGGGADQYNGHLLQESHGTVINNGTVETGLTRHVSLSLDSWDARAGTVSGTASDGVTFSTSQQLQSSTLALDLKNSKDLLAQYGSIDAKLNAYYSSEVIRIQQEMLDKGLGVWEDAAHTVFTPISSYVMTVTVDPIRAQAGRIDVRGDQLQGGGRWIAPTDASVTITNNTPAFLNLKGITIPAETGRMYFNGGLVGSNSAILSENVRNVNADNAHNFTNVDTLQTAVTPTFQNPMPTDATSGFAEPIITVTNALDVNDVNDGNTYVAPNITVLGASEGGVGISNLSGKLMIDFGGGAFISRGPVDAKNMVITGTGNVYIDGAAVFAQADPSSIWGGVTRGTTSDGITENGVISAETMQIDAFGAKVTVADTTNKIGNLLAQGPTSAGSLIAQQIFIRANIINVNGLIQSGKDNYTLNLDGSAAFEVSEKLRLGFGGTFKLEQTTAATGKDFSVWFNSVTQSFEIRDVSVSGGSVTLEGKIVNTGNGKIRVLSGYGQININNTTAYGVQVAKIDASQRGAGTLVIIDKAKLNGSGNPTSTLYNQNGAIGNYTYDPSAQMRFGWAVSWGTRTLETIHRESSNWLGLINLGSFDESGKVVTNIGLPTLEGGAGFYYSETNSSLQDDPYNFSQNSVQTNGTAPEAQWRETYHEVRSSWYGKKTYITDYAKRVDTKTVAHHDINAHRQIGIEFFGGAEATVNISSTSSRDVVVGNILNTSGTTTITSGGAIRMSGVDGAIGGRRVVLTAANGIGTDQRAVTTNVTDTGSSSLYAVTSKGDVNVVERSGDLAIDQVKATAGGNVNIVVPKNLFAAAGYDGLVQGSRINIDTSATDTNVGGGVGNST